MSEPVDPYEARAARHRAEAIRLKALAATHDIAAAAALAEGGVRQFVDAWNMGVARDVAEHPDLAELNVQMDGFYEDGPVRPGEERVVPHDVDECEWEEGCRCLCSECQGRPDEEQT